VNPSQERRKKKVPNHRVPLVKKEGKKGGEIKERGKVKGPKGEM